MEIRIENRPTSSIAFIRKIGPYGSHNVEAMESLKEWARSEHLLNEDSIIVGIPRDNPEQTMPENCRYDTCLLLDQSKNTVNADIQFTELPGGKYAILTIPHTAAAIQKAWQTLFSTIAVQRLKFDADRPIFEEYRIKLVMNHKCEICIPIK